MLINANILFYFFASLLIISAVMVILSNHPIFSLVYLISCFLLSSFILFLLECEFLGLLFIVIYVGAIAVLFLFAIMMLEIKSINLSKNFIKYVPVSLIFIVFLLMPFIKEITKNFNNNIYINTFYINKYQNWFDLIDAATDIEIYGETLYSFYILHFLIIGLILLIVLIGVGYLTNNFNSSLILKQSVSKQLFRNSNFFLK